MRLAAAESAMTNRITREQANAEKASEARAAAETEFQSQSTSMDPRRFVRDPSRGGKPVDAIGFSSEGPMLAKKFSDPLDPELEAAGMTEAEWAWANQSLRLSWSAFSKAPTMRTIEELQQSLFAPKDLVAVFAEYGMGQKAMTIYTRVAFQNVVCSGIRAFAEESHAKAEMHVDAPAFAPAASPRLAAPLISADAGATKHTNTDHEHAMATKLQANYRGATCRISAACEAQQPLDETAEAALGPLQSLDREAAWLELEKARAEEAAALEALEQCRPGEEYEVVMHEQPSHPHQTSNDPQNAQPAPEAFVKAQEGLAAEVAQDQQAAELSDEAPKKKSFLSRRLSARRSPRS